VYVFMNMAAFAVIVARERETGRGDDIANFEGLGRERPAIAWCLTISMIALAGLPGTAGFIGKLFLIEALVDGEFTWLAVMIAIGTMISLAYYLRVVAAMWMRPGGAEAHDTDLRPRTGLPAMAGGSPEADVAGAPATGTRPPVPVDPDAPRRAYLLGPALLATAATVFFGVIPQPLIEWAEQAGAAIFHLIG
jgi:NADH-quinone oxidoreductase subunit N